MFSIDLLEGKGLPEKVDPKRWVLKALPILIPVLAVTVLGAAYQNDHAALCGRQQQLKSNQQQLERYVTDVVAYNKMNARISDMKKYLTDLSNAMNYRMQVSELLVELAQTLPEDIFLYEMKLNRKAEQEKVQKEGSGEVKQRLVVQRNLKLVLCGHDPARSDAQVQEYIQKLKQSELLNTIFSDIKPPTRGQGEVDGRPAIYYEIECVLREQR